MTDRELLELAARAEGIDGPYVEADEGIPAYIYATDENDCNFCWNPLHNDADALRLAVKLELSLDLFSDRIAVAWTDEHGNFPQNVYDCTGDPLSTARRAIVSAAAEIGRSMK